MKTLQNNFTTLEQSKKLLELGVPADSADCIHIDVPTGYTRFLESKETVEYVKEMLRESYRFEVNVTPIWSVGRLMEIAHICSDSTLSYKEEANEIQKFKEEHKCETLIEAVIMCIADAVSIGGMDFSKLED